MEGGGGGGGGGGGERESTVCSPDGNFVCAFEGSCDLSDFLY